MVFITYAVVSKTALASKLKMRTETNTYVLLAAKSVFKISLLVILLTVLGVYFWGLGEHRTFFENSIISTTILSIVFFLFITIGLYRGVKLKDNLGQIIPPAGTNAVDLTPGSNYSGHGGGLDLDLDFGDEPGGIVLGIILWIFWAILVGVLLWIFSNVLAVVIAAFAAMLYWIFYRALRLVFKNSNKSRGKVMESIKYGLIYTSLYNFWIYGIFILTEYLKRQSL